MTLDIELFRRLCETPGIPGREERVRAVIEKTVLGIAGGGLFDTSHVDAMGSLICTRNATKGGGSRGAPARGLGARQYGHLPGVGDERPSPQRRRL